MARSRKTAPLDDAAPDPLQESVDLTIFDTIDDAWVYLAQARAVPRQDRQALLLRWIDLVAQKNPLEQDGLVQSGKETWGYRLETVRTTVHR